MRKIWGIVSQVWLPYLIELTRQVNERPLATKANN